MTRSDHRPTTSIRRLAPALCLVLFFSSCSNGGDDGANVLEPADTTSSTSPSADSDDVEVTTSGSDGATLTALVELLPADTSGAFAVDFDELMTGDSSSAITDLLSGSGSDSTFGEMFEAIGSLTEGIADPSTLTNAVLAQTLDPADGSLLLASLGGESIDGVSAGPVPGESENGSHVALLADGTLVVGSQSVVESIVDGAAVGTTTIPFSETLSEDSHISFAYGLPALFDDLPFDGTLETASAVTGALDVIDGAMTGDMSFHAPQLTEFVEVYNSLNRHTTQQVEPSEQPLVVADSAIEGLDQVVVTLPATPIEPSPGELAASRNLFKKLFVGMEASRYADGVADRSNDAWLDFLVKSEQDPETPRSPGSVYIRWEFRDQSAIDAFEANELPAGFKLAPTRFLESDDPAGEYFLALNLYNAGSSIVSGARAEWDVFVHPPEGADPNAGQRPRFFVVEALAEEVSADSGNLLTPAEPLSHELAGGNVVSSVQRFDDGQQIDVFESTFPAPDPAQADVARFTREMAIGNDYIYWAHGVSDRVLYNATTFNHDAYFVDTTQLTFTDNSPWAQYLKPTVKDAVYYDNTLEYVASPMANLDSAYLDITPEWLAGLVSFTTNGHQDGLMRQAVEQLFRGEADALVGERRENRIPSTYVNFEILDPAAMANAIVLPDGYSLFPISLTEGSEETHYLTLSVYEVSGSTGGPRAEWSVYVDDGSGRPRTWVLDLMTSSVAFDSANVVNLPNLVHHVVEDGVMNVRLSSATIDFEASFDTAGASEEELTLDWIEAGDIVCSSIGVCDKLYYDAETLDVPVKQSTDGTLDAFATPWTSFVEGAPSVVFMRDNAQQYVVAPWYNLDVAVDALPFGGLEGATHTISGAGTLTGRSTDIADSTYTYTGDAILDDEQLTFTIDQEINNALGVGNIYTTGSFDLMSGSGTVTVVDCQGSALLCSDIEPGSSTFYSTENLESSDPDAITWQVNVILDLGGSFGIADSTSTFEALRRN